MKTKLQRCLRQRRRNYIKKYGLFSYLQTNELFTFTIAIAIVIAAIIGLVFLCKLIFNYIESNPNIIPISGIVLFIVFVLTTSIGRMFSKNDTDPAFNGIIKSL